MALKWKLSWYLYFKYLSTNTAPQANNDCFPTPEEQTKATERGGTASLAPYPKMNDISLKRKEKWMKYVCDLS